MTGFGASEASFLGQVLRVELRAVNHRHLDVRVRVPSELGDLGSLVEDVLRARCGRGRIEAQVSFRGTPHAAELDVERARRAYQLLLTLRDELAPAEAVPLAAIFSVPGVFSTRAWQRDELEPVLREATERAVDELAAMRAREGKALSEDMTIRLGHLRSAGQAIEQLRPQVIDGAQKRLLKRIEKLLEGTGIAPDAGRVVQEIAWFADKSDVSEELTRLASHLDEFGRSLGSLTRIGEGVGRKLDFLVQEIGRELNTLGSKANDAEISRCVVDMKAELERIREQVQNIL